MTTPSRQHPQETLTLTSDQLLFTVEEAADLLRVGRTTMYALIRDGELRPIHIGRCCRVSRGELDRYVSRLDAQPVPATTIHQLTANDVSEDCGQPAGHPQDAA